MRLQRTGCLLLVSLAASSFKASTVYAQSQPATPPPLPNISVPLPERNPLRVAPVQPQEVTPPHPREQEATEWSAQEIQTARDECGMMLDGIGVVYREIEPIREGVCGTSGPIELSSIGSTPAVKIVPPARVTCGMAASLVTWNETVLQPSAQKYFDTGITEIRNVASYVCRNRYNAPNQRISEHALANALDMAAFKTSGGEWIAVLDHWGKRVESSPETAALAPSELQVPQQPPVTTEQTDPVAPATPSPADVSPELQIAEDTRKSTPHAAFLKELHTGGCRFFGTVLGPEANDAHKDHFHFDQAPRKHSNFCE